MLILSIQHWLLVFLIIKINNTQTYGFDDFVFDLRQCFKKRVGSKICLEISNNIMNH